MSMLIAAPTDAGAANALPLAPVPVGDYDTWLADQPAATATWLQASGFAAKAGRHALIPAADGGVAAVLATVARLDDVWALAALPTALPPGDYRLPPDLTPSQAECLALGWALGAYAFDRYKHRERAPARLILPDGADAAAVARMAGAVGLARDLINTPAQDLGPADLAEAVYGEGKRHGAEVGVIAGDQLLRHNYPTIHAVGRASPRAPRLVDLRWTGAETGPALTLVGKGVCFDTGGLDLKAASGMRLMKKDMGGAAHALALARLIMDAGLPVRLRLLIPAVDNAVDGSAFRPGDVLQTRKGLSVEIDNTDAEGRLVLADALAEAETDSPDLLLDFATLTGAARVALGPDLPAMFCNDDALAARLAEAGAKVQDPVWRLPLFDDYRSWLDSPIADLSNLADSPYGGAIVAALFLEHFVPANTPWAHFDFMAWNTAARPGRAKGGEAMGLRAAFEAVRTWVQERANAAG